MHYSIIIGLLLALFVQTASAQNVRTTADKVSTIVPVAALKSKITTSQLPLALTVPEDFSDSTKLIFEGNSRPDASVYCSPEDAELMRDQLRGKRVDVQAINGCLSIQKDQSSTFDPITKKFSVEKDIEAMNKWAPSTSPQFEVKNYSISKKEVRGRPILTFIQDSSTIFGKTKIRFLYVADGTSVWVVMFTSGRHENVSARIWDVVISGL